MYPPFFIVFLPDVNYFARRGLYPFQGIPVRTSRPPREFLAFVQRQQTGPLPAGSNLPVPRKARQIQQGGIEPGWCNCSKMSFKEEATYERWRYNFPSCGAAGQKNAEYRSII
jgi:hypothetical protein